MTLDLAELVAQLLADPRVATALEPIVHRAVVRARAQDTQVAQELANACQVRQRFGRTADGWKRLCRKHRAELAEFKRGRGLWYWPGLEAWGRARGLL